MKTEKVINPESSTETETKSQFIAIYQPSEAALVALEEMTKDAVVDLTTKQGIEDCKDAAKKFQKVRTGVENLRKEETKEQRDYIAKVNDQAKTITARILPLENKFKAPLDERRDAFKAKIAEIDAMPSLHANSPSEVIGNAIAELENIMPSDFAEFQKDCKASLFTANDKLTELLTAAVAAEELAKQEAEETQRREEEHKRQQALIEENAKREAIQARITKLQQIPLDLNGKTSGEIKAKQDSLNEYTPTAEEFGDRLAEVQSMMAVTVGQLGMMFSQASQLEEMQAKIAMASLEEAQTVKEPEQVETPKAATLRSQGAQCEDLNPTGNEVSTTVEQEEKAPSNFRPIAALAEEDEPLYSDVIADAPKNKIVEAAMTEVCTETKQSKAAEVMCELMAGEMTLDMAKEIIGLIDAELIPYTKFDA